MDDQKLQLKWARIRDTEQINKAQMIFVHDEFRPPLLFYLFIVFIDFLNPNLIYLFTSLFSYLFVHFFFKFIYYLPIDVFNLVVSARLPLARRFSMFSMFPPPTCKFAYGLYRFLIFRDNSSFVSSFNVFAYDLYRFPIFRNTSLYVSSSNVFAYGCDISTSTWAPCT
jgi:hypothetical protein